MLVQKSNELGVCHLGLVNPKAVESDRMLRRCVITGMRATFIATHLEGAAGHINHHHLIDGTHPSVA
jgi:hypothetical protein